MTKVLSLLAAAAALSQFLAAQTSMPASIYSSSISYHVPEETRMAFEAWMKDKGKRLQEAMMQEDPAVQSVILTRVVFGGVQEPAANYYLSTFSQGVPKNHASMMDKISQKLFGKSYQETLKEVYPLRKRLGQTLAWQAVTTGSNVAEGDLVRIDRKKVTPGRMGDYLALEKSYQPLREAQVAAGKMKAWSAWTVVLPGGTERDFDAFTSHIAKDLESSMSWNQGAASMAVQLNPPLNLAGAAMRANDVAKTTVGETRLVVMMIRRP
ncbi:MAG: hypothetical protein K2X03_16175 [Bryobacteraceae bacterium]|nr:hypothetical protein [Bryobacteraceae bacterium]